VIGRLCHKWHCRLTGTSLATSATFPNSSPTHRYHPAGLDISFLFQYHNLSLFVFFPVSYTTHSASMQTNRPSRNRGGLPPAPRSRSVTRQDEPSTSYRSYSHESSSRSDGTSSSRQVRPQRLMTSARDRSDASPMPQPRQTSRANKSSRDYESPSMNRKESDASSTSMSSTASSFLDRLRGGGDSSGSRTSLEEEYEPPKRSRRQESSQESRSFEQGHEDSTLATSVGSALWGRLAFAVGTLGVDVGKAWTTNITVNSGEETPPGKESRLTQAMKAYHLEKARDPSDLPEWLFESHERQPVGRSRLASSQHTPQDDSYEESTPTPSSRGLRDIYEAAAAPRTSGNADRPTRNRFPDEPAAPSKATNRLKAIRDAKRQNAYVDTDPSVRSTSVNSDGRDAGDGKRWDRAVAEVYDARPAPRVGLPSRPGGGRRF